VLEITLGQEQTQAAERILELAASKSIILAFPGFALSEPFATLAHRGKEQLRLSKSLSDMLRQLKRSAPHQASSTTLSAAPTIRASIASVELSRLQTTTQRLLDAGEYLPLQGAVFREATLYQSRYGLSPQDSVIYAVVEADVRARPSGERKCFISRNWKVFRNPGILAELTTYQCTYAESFAEGLTFIASQP